jgi:hypothetical protein
MPKTKTKKEVKELIQFSNFLPNGEKKEWLALVDTLNQDELDATYDHFKKRIQKENEIKLKLIVKGGLEKKLLTEVKKISKKYLLKAKKHKEK